SRQSAAGRGGSRSSRQVHAVVADDDALHDPAAPGAGRLAALLDELLELLEVALDPPRDEAERVAGLLQDTLGLEVEPQRDERAAGAVGGEGDGARIVDATLAAPGDPLVRLLLDDLGVPLDGLAADLRLPVQVGGVELLHSLDALHELREGLELRPLVVRGADRDVDADALLFVADVCHVALSSAVG